MLSIRARLINGAFRAARRVGVTDRFTRTLADPEALAAGLHRIRRFDVVEPPRRARRGRRHERVEVRGGRLHILGPADRARGRVVLYFHGGGYMFGPAGMHWSSAGALADEAEADLAMLIYPMTPEHDHEATIAAALEAYEHVVARYGAHEVVVAGDSAGGGLVATLLGLVREGELPRPRAAILVSPWLDLSLADPAARDHATTDLILDVDAAVQVGTYYAGHREPTDPLVSPLYATTSGWPPVHVFAGTEEIFLPDCRSFVAKARANGEVITLRVLPKGQHVSAIFPTPEGRVARGQMLALIDWP